MQSLCILIFAALVMHASAKRVLTDKRLHGQDRAALDDEMVPPKEQDSSLPLKEGVPFGYTPAIIKELHARLGEARTRLSQKVTEVQEKAAGDTAHGELPHALMNAAIHPVPALMKELRTKLDEIANKPTTTTTTKKEKQPEEAGETGTCQRRMDEFISTEEALLQTITFLVDTMVPVLKTPGGGRRHGVQRVGLWMEREGKNLQTVLTKSVERLKGSLGHADQSVTDATRFVAAFNDVLPDLQAYVKWILSFQAMNSCVDHAYQVDGEMRSEIEEAMQKQDPEAILVRLESLIVQPVQRPTRYQMFLDDLGKRCDVDPETLKAAKSGIKELNMAINEQLKAADAFAYTAIWEGSVQKNTKKAFASVWLDRDITLTADHLYMYGGMHKKRAFSLWDIQSLMLDEKKETFYMDVKTNGKTKEYHLRTHADTSIVGLADAIRSQACLPMGLESASLYAWTPPTNIAGIEVPS